MHTRFLIVGAGMTGLAFANFIESDDYLILERDAQIGGWCKTVQQDGFVWDYSGHFFHFRNPDIEDYLRARLPDGEVVTVQKDARILYGDTWIDFPFQKNIHQLPKKDFIECLHDLVLRDDVSDGSFKSMLYTKFGRGIAEKFLIPYNEKLYACGLDTLDANAMGRFFPHADLEDIVRNMRSANNSSYNSAFTYPRNGAIMYVNALKSEIPDSKISLQESLKHVDLANKVATTSEGRNVTFEYLVSSAPLNRFLDICGLDFPAQALTYNKVLVFNFGFDSKGPPDVHWVYFPERKYPFYRVGFYDNISGTDRMSLYVEVGYRSDDKVDVEGTRKHVLAGLRESGVITSQKLISEHHVVLDPAYVHITQESIALQCKVNAIMQSRGVHSIGRYGGWTYCSIEDNILEARELARTINQGLYL